MSNPRKPRSTSRRSRAARTLEAGLALSLALGDAGCTPGSSASAQRDAPSAVPPAAPPGPSAIARLSAQAVVSTRVARRTLFTWTTPEQIEELARDRVLLTREESPVHGPAFFDQVVAARAAAGDPLAQRLRTRGFARSRFAWPAPWATILGWPGETYGEELIAVDLRPTAWIARLFTSKPGFEVVDLADKPVPLADALASPERIGAVYFVHDQPATGFARTSAGPAERAGFREYVLCNESMIETWSIRTPRLAEVIEGSAALIEAVRRELPSQAPGPPSIDAWNAEVVRSIWPGPEVPTALAPLYEATLAFPNERYALTAERLDALARKLRTLTVRGAALTHQPTAPPPAPSAQLPPPVVRPKTRKGTYARRGSY